MTVYAIIAGIVALISAYFSWLHSKLNNKDLIIASLKANAENKEFKDAIDATTKMVTETTIDYQKASTDFRAKYGSGDGTDTGSKGG